MRSMRARVKGNHTLRAALFLAQNAWYGAPSFVTRRRSTASGERPRYRLTAMIRVKDEARFLPEWLAHHVGIGVEHCYIYDNNSGDRIETVMAPFIERGLATCVHWPHLPASPSSHVDFLERFGDASEWVTFFDADEFLVESAPGELLRVLRSRPHWPAVAVSSRYFGSAGHERIPRGLVTDRFDRASATISDHVKVIARPAAIHRYRNPHNFYYRRGRLARTPDGGRVFGSFVRAPAAPSLVLHHYVCRSREDYENKARRGYSTIAGAVAQARRASRAAAEFARHNDVQATVPASTRQETARLLEQLGYADELYASTATSVTR